MGRINFQKRFRNALQCPMPSLGKIMGSFEVEMESGSHFYPSATYLALPMAQHPQFQETGLRPSLNVKEVLMREHRIKFLSNTEVFWVKLARGHSSTFRDEIVLRRGKTQRRGVVVAVVRRKGLQHSAVVVINF
jgi:hypothetical protein